MVDQDMFANINTAMDLSNNANDDLLGRLVILSALFTEFAVAGVIAAEADKIEFAIDSDASVEQLTTLDNSIAGVLQQLCCIEQQVNEKIAQAVNLLD